MMGIYTFLMTIILVAVYPAALVLAVLGKPHLWRRMYLPGPPEDGGEGKRVWIHAASVGEAGIAFSLAREIKRRFPGSRIYVSTITTSGLDRIKRLGVSDGDTPVDRAFLAPFDHPFITGSFIRRLKPSSFILVETELWPWLITSIHRREIPISIVNGKISKRAFRRYMLVRKWVGELVGKISLVCVQSRSYARRFRLLGVSRDRIEIIGNVKFDGLPGPDDYDGGRIRCELNIPEKAKVFVAGSTRPGEEEILLRAFGKVLGAVPEAVMVLAPRHLNRLPEVEKTIRAAGMDFVKRSLGHGIGDTGRKVMIVDTMGELVRIFACADAAFVGGSLSDFGGHNPLEPAALGVPVIFGQFMEQTGSKELLSDGAAILVHDEDELASALISIFSGDERHRRMSHAGPTVVRRFRGTLSRTVQTMENRGLL